MSNMKLYYHPPDLKKKLVAEIAICDSLPVDMLIYSSDQQALVSKIMLGHGDHSVLPWATRDYDPVIDMYRLSMILNGIEIIKYAREDEQ